MKHGIKQKKLNRTSSHRKALFSNMSNAFFKHERISTTLAKAKALRPVIEKLITKAKAGDVNSRRIIFSKLRDERITNILVSELAPRFKDRNGGYTRIIKTGVRKGDAAPTAIIELVDVDYAKLEVKRKRKVTDKSTGQKVEA